MTGLVEYVVLSIGVSVGVTWFACRQLYTSNTSIPVREENEDDEVVCPYCHTNHRSVDEAVNHLIDRHNAPGTRREVRKLLFTEDGDA